MHAFRVIFMLWGASLVIGLPLQAHEELILACAYYDKVDPAANSSLVHSGLPWVWAKGFDGENIYVSGSKVDGFFEVSDLVGRVDGYFGTRIVAKYPNSVAAAKELCQLAIEEAFPNDYYNKVVLNMMVKSSFLSIHHTPLVFKELMAAGGQTLDKIVIFGDSLSDQGNLKTWLRILPRAPYFGGRFTNGPNWVDQLQEQTGAAVQNWAVGGSVSHMDDDEDYKLSTRISGSVEEEIGRYRELTLEGGKLADPKRTLFVMWIGGNDYLSKLDSPAEADIFIDQPNNRDSGSNIVMAEVTENIIQNLRDLRNIGAQNFLVLNLPDMGTMPKLLGNKTYHANTKESSQGRLVRLSLALTQISDLHGRELKRRLDMFQQEYPDTKIMFGDTHGGVRNTMRSRHFSLPHKFFNYQLDPAFMRTFVHAKSRVTINQACFFGSMIRKDLDKVCPTPDRTLFWDHVHPSSFGHCLLALGIQRTLHQYGLMGEPNPNSYFQRCRPELLF